MSVHFSGDNELTKDLIRLPEAKRKSILLHQLAILLGSFSSHPGKLFVPVGRKDLVVDGAFDQP